MAKPGVRMTELNDYAMEYIIGLGGDPVFATEEHFPGAINTSVNDAVVHGVPTERKLEEGDVLSIDAGMILDGYAGDATVTIAVGDVGVKRQRLIETTHEAMMVGIRAARTGKRVGDIGHAMQRYAEMRGYRVVREFIGHGLGHKMHEPPQVPSVGMPNTGPMLREGLVLTIEPILVEGSAKCFIDDDGWTVRTEDGGWAAQWEHTVVVQTRGGKILSLAG